MRLLFLPMTLAALSWPSSAFAPAGEPAPAVERPRAIEQLTADNCRRTTSHYADTGSVYRGEPLAPRKLDELPDATGYMAVYRTVDGCEEPMTIVEYRQGEQR